jgi:peroxiredoxin Q/BCP
MTEKITLTHGDAAPAFTTQDHTGQTVSLDDYRGKTVILYFYPQAATPGCTTEACDFRDSLSSFASAGIQVLGISPDAPAKNKAFADKEHLTFPLLSDEDHAIAEAYGAWGEKKNYGKTYVGLIRSTVVIGPEGSVDKAFYNVKATGHVARLRRELGLDA